MKKTLLILLTLTLTLPLFACGGSPDLEAPTDTAVEEATEAVVEPTQAPEPTEITTDLVSSVGEIVGTWIAAADLGNFIIIISEDGMFRVATSSEDLERGSTESWKLTFDESGQISATGYALCLGETGSYLANLNPDGTLKFSTITDSCTNRIRRMDRSLPGRLTPYNLIYYPVK